MSSSASAATEGCRTCHPSHYTGIGGCVSCHGGNGRTTRKEIAHSRLIAGRFAHFNLPGSAVVEAGKKLLDQAACRRCHNVGGKGNTMAADLDRVFTTSSPEEVFTAIKKPVPFMPDFRFSDGEIAALVNAIESGAKSAGGREIPLVVHFAETSQRIDNAFVRLCGSCHRALSKRYGAIGMGQAGPNLSGLFSVYYPATFTGGNRWKPDTLNVWLKNPRKQRQNALMRPVVPSRQELISLIQVLDLR